MNVQINTTLPAELAAQVAQIAKRDHTSLASVARRLIARALRDGTESEESCDVAAS